jgi:hypothetical protein
MRRRAGLLVLLGMLGGCVNPPPDPVVYNLPAGDRAGAGGPLRPRGPAGYQDWAGTQGSRGDRADGPRGLPAATVAGLASTAPAGPLATPAVRPPDVAGVTVVNGKRLQINYEIKDVGPSGLGSVDLWYTYNGGPWKRYGTAPKEPPYVIDVKDEGRYGFLLLAHNRAGLGKDRPADGDAPQAVVEVDLTKPNITVVPPQYDPKANTLTIVWQATDRNLGERSIALCWSKEPAGPWVPIITQLTNTGRYVWKLPDGLPGRFYVQVEATDLAGNVATVRAPDAVALAPTPAAGPPASAVVTAAARQPAAPADGSNRPRRLTLTLEPLGN